MRSGRRESCPPHVNHKVRATSHKYVGKEASFMCEKGEHGWGVITEKHSSIGQRKQLESDSQAATQLLLYIAGTRCSLHHRWGFVVIVSERMRDSFWREEWVRLTGGGHRHDG